MSRARFGQHFLVDGEIIQTIIESAEIGADDIVVEIGPGKGALTSHLAGCSGNLTLLEPDRRLADELRRAHKNARVLVQRGEAINFAGFPAHVVVVSNLPYYASVQIFKHLSENKGAISRMVLMFQKEVAQRISAGPGGRHYGSLSVWSSYNWEMEQVVTVPAKAFAPPPKVESAALRFRPRLKPPVDGDEQELFKLVRSSFVLKRRTLVNNLKNIYPADALNAAMESADLGPKARAEEVSLEQFAKLSQLLGSPPLERKIL
ncbi:MAG: ribosomal RNA small subunit methyltransferase A [Nitrospinae bacterium]|nr:ribosomal RNA small subunit methyltransferase A [Nitrospinota bacterium]